MCCPYMRRPHENRRFALVQDGCPLRVESRRARLAAQWLLSRMPRRKADELLSAASGHDGSAPMSVGGWAHPIS